jgi:hypothetical protein
MTMTSTAIGNEAEVAKRLLELRDSRSRSKTSRLREVFVHVEAALSAGSTRQQVLAELNSLGLNMTVATFNTSLQRIRARESKKAVTHFIAPATISGRPPLPVASSLEKITSTASPSHNPADLNRIMESTPDLSALSKLAKRIPR